MSFLEPFHLQSIWWDRRLDHIDLSIKEGEILGLIGRMGRKPPSLCSDGPLQADKGEILFRDQRIDGLAPHAIASLGIARTFPKYPLFTT